ncbi:MAG TPA: PHP domain-containing protein [Ignavibacteriales bacterium]|nr:PHP domain-containing protein [Ignavibacteriales bacterium]
MGGKIDLHMHTYYSDGQHSPEELILKVKEAGIDIISVTDHDTVGGISEATEAGKKLGVEVIPGLEISSDIRDREVHLLAYFFDPANKQLEEYLKFFRAERIKRAIIIIEKLKELGLVIELDDVLTLARNSAVGRPHIAKVLVKKGLVSNYFEAFSKYIGNGGPAYERKVHVSPRSAFKIINDAGGLSFIAHPGNLPDAIMVELIDAGLDGIEVVHPSHLPHLVKHYRGIVNEFFLLESGGSDFHGGDRNDYSNLGKYSVAHSKIEAMQKQILRNAIKQ